MKGAEGGGSRGYSTFNKCLTIKETTEIAGKLQGRQRERERGRGRVREKETVKGTDQISLKLPPSSRTKRANREMRQMVKQVVNLIFLAKAKQSRQRLPAREAGHFKVIHTRLAAATATATAALTSRSARLLYYFKISPWLWTTVCPANGDGAGVGFSFLLSTLFAAVAAVAVAASHNEFSVLNSAAKAQVFQGFFLLDFQNQILSFLWECCVKSLKL